MTNENTSEMLRQLSTRDLHAMIAGSATELAQRWILQTPGASEYLKAGWGLSLEVTLKPEPGLVISFLDNDSTRFRHPAIPLDSV